MEIRSANGFTILIDDCDVDLATAFTWNVYAFANDILYATSRACGRTIYMHRWLMDAPDGIEVDHINGNGLDNRRTANLRLATHAENLANQRLSVANSSGFRGVVLSRNKSNPWHAQIKHLGKQYHLGHYETPEFAARVYDVKARELFGRFARLNFPNDPPILIPDRRLLRATNSSGFRGVAFNLRRKKWEAYATANGKKVVLGFFTDLRDASVARARYDELGTQV